MDDLHRERQEQVASEEQRRHERVLWIWTWVAAAGFLMVFAWWMALSLSQG
jgi:hypothetical protein